jgi:hypothetical protein
MGVPSYTQYPDSVLSITFPPKTQVRPNVRPKLHGTIRTIPERIGGFGNCLKILIKRYVAILDAMLSPVFWNRFRRVSAA